MLFSADTRRLFVLLCFSCLTLFMSVEEMWQFSLIFIQVGTGSISSEAPSTQDGQTSQVWVDVQNGIGWKEPGFQMWWTGSSGYSASQKLGVLSWRAQGFARHICASNILQIVGCGGEENAQKSWQISWRWYFLSQRKIKIMLQKPKTKIMKNFYVI